MGHDNFVFFFLNKNFLIRFGTHRPWYILWRFFLNIFLNFCFFVVAFILFLFFIIIIIFWLAAMGHHRLSSELQIMEKRELRTRHHTHEASFLHTEGALPKCLLSRRKTWRWTDETKPYLDRDNDRLPWIFCYELF